MLRETPSKTFDEELTDALEYDPGTGRFWWLVKPAKNVMAGSEAGTVKATRVNAAGKSIAYKYIRFMGREIPAARVAWFLHHGEWPLARLIFEDGDSLNLHIDNLVMANALPRAPSGMSVEERKEYMIEHRKSYPLYWKDQQLQTDFGISLGEYFKMWMAQDQKCAICDRPERQMRKGRPKMLAVDHNHETGTVRGLLCAACNQAIGKLEEDRNILLSAIRYLDKHSGEENVTVLTPIVGGDT